MNFEIRNEWPPNIEAIRAKFKLCGREIFAWDGIIYNPSGARLSDALIAHELVHFKQQQGNPEEWWRHYLADPDLRFAWELEAHAVEYRVAAAGATRNERRLILKQLARRLASPTYGSMVTFATAKRLLEKGFA